MHKAVTRIQAVIMIGIVVIAASVAGYYFYSTLLPKPGVKEIVIGALFPQSGLNALVGIAARQGVELSVDDINVGGGINSLGGAKLRMVATDITSDPTSAMSQTERLITSYHPDFLIGCYASALTYVASQVAERYKIPFFTCSSANDITQRGLNYTFRYTARAEAEGRANVDIVYEVGKNVSDQAKTLAIIYENSIWGMSNDNVTKNRALELGFEIVLDEAYQAGLTDATPLVTKLKNAKPDAVIAYSYTNDALLITRTMQEQNFRPNKAFLGSAGFTVPEYLAGAGTKCEGFFAPFIWHDDLAEPILTKIDNLTLAERYDQKFGTPIGQPAGEYYIAAWLIKEILEKSGSSDPDLFRNAALEIDIPAQSSPAVAGLVHGVNFDKTGENIYAIEGETQILNGKFAIIWPFNVSQTQPVWPIRPAT